MEEVKEIFEFNQKKWDQENRYYVEVYDMNEFGCKDKPKYGVNWQALGEVDTVAAKEFIGQLQEAIALCEKYNNEGGC